MILLALVIKSTTVLLAGLAAVGMMRRRSAALRHAVLASAVLAAAAMPAVQAVTPVWWSWQTPPPRPTAPVVLVGESLPHAAQAAANEVTPAEARHPLSLGLAAVALWVLASTISVARLVRRLRYLRHLDRSTPVLTSDLWRERLTDAATRVTTSLPVTLRTGGTATPFTWGLRKPRILLPLSASTWSSDQAALVLAHELAHVRRHDWAWLIAMEVARAVYIWHPLMWLAVRAAREHAEHACDDIVLEGGTTPSSYAQVLVDLAAAAGSRPSSIVTAMANVSSLERRIEIMLDGSISHAPGRAPSRWLAGVAVLILTIGVAGAAAQATGDGTGIVAGVVRPGAGQPMADVEIVFTGPEQVRARTNAAGEFSVALPAGSYRSRIKVPGFRATEAVVDIGAGERIARDFTLALGALSEAITISGPTDSRDEPVDLSPGLKLPTTVGVITLPRTVSHQPPAYPNHLREAGIEGTVRVNARIDPDGHVNDVTVAQSPHGELSQAVIEAVGRWRYQPTRVQGTPVSTEIVVTVDYRAN